MSMTGISEIAPGFFHHNIICYGKMAKHYGNPQVASASSSKMASVQPEMAKRASLMVSTLLSCQQFGTVEFK